MLLYKTKADKIFDVCNYMLMILVIFITLFPFWTVLVGSFNEGLDLMKGGVYFWPRKFSLDNYQAVFKDRQILIAYKITVLRTLIGTISSVFVTALFAYGFSRKVLKGRSIYAVIGLTTLFFHGGVIPTYLVIKQLGLLNNFWVYIFPLMFNFFNVLIMQAYFRGIPDSIIESAKIDGAGEYTIFFRLILPLSKPVLAAITLFTGVRHWNSFFDSLLYTTRPELQTIQLYLMKVIRSFSQVSAMMSKYGSGDAAQSTATAHSVQYATMMVVTIPILMLYPFLQKYFVKGIMIGAVKG